MKHISVMRILCTVVALLVAVTGGVSLALSLDAAPTSVEVAAGPSDPGTLAPPATTPTPTSAPTTTLPRPTTTTALPATTTTTTTTPPDPTDPGVSLRRGDTGTRVVELQRGLRDLGYWSGTASDTFGPLLEQAVTAFQKVHGLARDGVAGPNTRAALAGATRPTVSATGDLVEIDKARQVLFVVRGGAVKWTLNVSTGTEKPYQVEGRTELADTPPGDWTVDWVVDGNDVGALGALYRPRYFHRDGIAVHGYHSVPAYPASHGCVRVTEAAMDWIWASGLMPLGSAVWVH